MLSRILPLLLAAATALLAACYESTKPLSPAGGVLHDTTVLGSWTCVPDPPLRPQDKATLTLRNVDQWVYDAAWTDGDKTSRFRAHGSKIESTVVLNVLEVAPNAKWFFVRYKREGNKLYLRVANDQQVKGGYEARKMDDVRARAASDELFLPFAVCTRSK